MPRSRSNEHVTSDELLLALDAVNTGEDPVVPTEDPFDVFHGEVEYRANSGWVFRVYNRCGYLKYMDHAIAPDGREWDFDDDPYLNVTPEDEIGWRYWRLPGWWVSEDAALRMFGPSKVVVAEVTDAP